MKVFFLLLYAVLVPPLFGQYALTVAQRDSLTRLLAEATEDTAKCDLLNQIAYSYQNGNPEKAEAAMLAALKLARTFKDKDRLMGCLISLGFLYSRIGEPVKSIEMQLEALRYWEKTNGDVSMPLAFIGFNYEALGDLPNALEYARRSYWAYEKRRRNQRQIDPRGYAAGPMRLGILFEKTGRPDSALYYAQMAYGRVLENQSGDEMAAFYCEICNLLGNLHSGMNQPATAGRFYRLALGKAEALGFTTSLQESQLALARFYQRSNRPDSAVHYASSSLENARILKHFVGIQQAAALLREVYERKGIFDKALYFNDLSIAARDSISGAEKVREAQRLKGNEEQRELKIQQEVEAKKIAYRNSIRLYALMAGLAGALLLAMGLYQNNQRKRRVNTLLQAQKEEIDAQKSRLQHSLETLKAAQAQLIQSEKLASLGELTAGIAHEIQNPLNFVNNFSELSVDLAEELSEEVDKELIDKDLVKDLIGDLTQNQQKINHHGKRAAAIVSGMLQHARVGVGKKEPTDLNALADEYLRLAYHGLRAKDPNFNAAMITDFDPAVGKADVIPQDIGRVLLNLINNAFYAVQQRAKQGLAPDLPGFKNLEGLDPSLEGLDARAAYEPTVVISTQKIENQIIIKVEDNGGGISDAVKAKIFHPFFTTKPTGQGTGLGLSLAWDIVVKGHGGTLEVESTEGVGSKFIIRLPL